MEFPGALCALRAAVKINAAAAISQGRMVPSRYASIIRLGNGAWKAGGPLLQDRQFQVIGGHKQTAFRDPLRGGASKVPGEFVTGSASGEH